MKVLTAYNKKHEYFLSYCKDSVPKGVEHLVQFDEGNGKAWAMNKLLKKVSDNDVVVVCDADDMLSPQIQKIEWMMSDYDLVYGDVYELSESGEKSLRKSKSFDINLFKKENLIPFSGVMLWGWLAKRHLYPDCFPVEDWVWWHELYQHSQRFGYSGYVHATRRVWTSNVARNIPVYSKINRHIRNYKAKRIIKSIYES